VILTPKKINKRLLQAIKARISVYNGGSQMIIHNGENITLEILDNGNLRLNLTAEGKEFLLDKVENSDENEIFFRVNSQMVLFDLLEDIICNSEIELLNEVDYAKIGALTDAPIIAFNVRRDDNGELLETGKVFWFEKYAIQSELENLLTNGFTDFDAA
jgi:hypothetical protein